MNSRLSPRNRLRTGLKLSLGKKILIGIGIFVFLAGIGLVIFLTSGPAKKSQAEVQTNNEPSSNNAHFDASPGSYIDFGAAANATCFPDLVNSRYLTITMWVKWEDKSAAGVSGWANLFTLNDSTGNGDNGVFWVQHNDDNTRFEFALTTTGSGRQFIYSNTVPAEGQWYHLACVYDGNPSRKRMMIYVNGVLEATKNNISGTIAGFSPSTRLNMGRWSNPQNNFRHFNGNLDEVSIWKVALTASQVAGMMSNPESVTGNSYNSNGLISYWNFDDMTANSLGPCINNGLPGSGVALPVELISFAGQKSGRAVNLHWATASEHNNYYFFVERSPDMINFEEIGGVYGAGESNTLRQYTLSDDSPAEGMNYYRLRQIDYDGKFTYSHVIVVNMSGGEMGDAGSLNAGPNPFSDRLYLNYTANSSGPVYIQMFNTSGMLLREEEAHALEGSNTLMLETLNNLQEGHYLVCIRQNQSRTPCVKVIKAG